MNIYQQILEEQERKKQQQLASGLYGETPTVGPVPQQVMDEQQARKDKRWADKFSVSTAFDPFRQNTLRSIPAVQEYLQPRDENILSSLGRSAGGAAIDLAEALFLDAPETAVNLGSQILGLQAGADPAEVKETIEVAPMGLGAFSAPQRAAKRVVNEVADDDIAQILLNAPEPRQSITYQPRGERIYDTMAGPNPRAEDLDELGFYSPTRRAASRIQEKGTGAQMKAQLLKSGLSGERIGEEMQDIGLDKWLDSKDKVTRQEIIDYVDANRVGYDEVRSSSYSHETLAQAEYDLQEAEKSILDELSQYLNNEQMDDAIDELTSLNVKPDDFGSYIEDTYGVDLRNYNVNDYADDWVRNQTMLDNANDAGFDAKYKKYALEGGENYRENLMTVPQYGRIDVQPLSRAEIDEMWALGVKMREKGNLPPEQMSIWRDLKDRDNQYREAVESADRGVYQSSHYSQPNIGLTTRTQSFKTNDGQNVHLIDELQSDWHDEGRKKGYAGQESPRFLELRDRINNEGVDALNSQEWGEYNRLFNVNKGVGDAVPDAPAKTAWKQQGLRRELTRAIQQGDDYIALTGGVEQAKRYNLRKQIETIDYDPNTKLLVGYSKGGNKVFQEYVAPDKIDDYLGKGVGDTLRNKISDNPTRNLTEEEVKRMYDLAEQRKDWSVEFTQAQEDELNRLKQIQEGKTPNVRLEGQDLEIGTEGKKKLYDKDFLGKLTKDVKRLDPNAKVEVIELNNGKKVWGIKITPEMKTKVKTEGMSLYSAAPVAGVTAAMIADELSKTDKKREY